MKRALHEILTTSGRATSVFPFSLQCLLTFYVSISFYFRCFIYTSTASEATVWDDCVSYQAWYPHHHHCRQCHRHAPTTTIWILNTQAQTANQFIFWAGIFLPFILPCLLNGSQDIYRHLQPAHIMGTKTSGWQCHHVAVVETWNSTGSSSRVKIKTVLS